MPIEVLKIVCIHIVCFIYHNVTKAIFKFKLIFVFMNVANMLLRYFVRLHRHRACANI